MKWEIGCIRIGNYHTINKKLKLKQNFLPLTERQQTMSKPFTFDGILNSFQLYSVQLKTLLLTLTSNELILKVNYAKSTKWCRHVAILSDKYHQIAFSEDEF